MIPPTPPPTEHHGLHDPRTWFCLPNGGFRWATRDEMQKMGFPA